MSVPGKIVNIIKCICMLILLLALAPAAFAQEPYVVKPVQNPDQVRPLPASAWPPPESDQSDLLLKLAYLRGVLDALQYAEVAPKTIGKVLKELEGMNLHQVAAAIDRYYIADPRRRSMPPASVLFRVLPRERGQVEPSSLPRPGRPARPIAPAAPPGGKP
jgi:hypothetical protein